MAGDTADIGVYSAAYSGASLAFRDRLVIEWNKTQQRQTFADQKRVYCMLWLCGHWRGLADSLQISPSNS
jgi:hypothetical protein